MTEPQHLEDQRAEDGYESDGSDEDGDQDVAELNSVLQKLRLKLGKGILKRDENANMRMNRERVSQIVAAIKADVKPEEVEQAFKDVLKKQAEKVAKQPRDLAAEYLAAMRKPPAAPRTLTKVEQGYYELFLTSRDKVRAVLGIDDHNAAQWVVAWADAGDNAKKLAAYLGVAGMPLEDSKVKGFSCVILYGHTGYGPLPFGQHGTDPGDPRLGQNKLYTPGQVAGFLKAPQQLAVIGCDSENFAAALRHMFDLPIAFTVRPFQWRKAGQCPEYLLAQDSGTKEIYGTLIDVLRK